MTLIQKIISLAIESNPAAVELVLAGVKPCAFMGVKFREDISSISHKIISYPGNPNVMLFIQNYSPKGIDFMIFNLQSIEKKITVLNKKQSSFSFKDAKSVVTHHRNLYKKIIKNTSWKEMFSRQQKKDINLIQGIIFGFPMKNISTFIKELDTNSFIKGRKFYVVKKSPTLVFVGYPGMESSSKALIKKWERAFSLIMKKKKATAL